LMTIKQYDEKSLVVHPGRSKDADVLVEVIPKQVGWEKINFQARKLAAGHTWTATLMDKEAALIVLSGILDVDSNKGSWKNIGKRENVFSGLPYALYLPIKTKFTVHAIADCEFAVAQVPAEREFPAHLIKPDDVRVEIRGGDHATRQINSIIPPDFPCQHLVVVEVYTPGGNWSSFPPHKHDLRKIDEQGTLVEADLEEIYFYKIDKPEGFALQRVYTGSDSPLQQAGKGFDVSVVLKENDVVLVPEGYHPVSSPPGYLTYYLNVLAGSDQVLTAQDDPDYQWIKETYQSVDPRLPIYPIHKP